MQEDLSFRNDENIGTNTTSSEIAEAFIQMDDFEVGDELIKVKKLFTSVLGLEKDSKLYKKYGNSFFNYFGNGCSYLMKGIGDITEEQAKNNYILLMDILRQAESFSPEQKESFLAKVHEAQLSGKHMVHTTSTYNHFHIMTDIIKEIIAKSK